MSRLFSTTYIVAFFGLLASSAHAQSAVHGADFTGTYDFVGPAKARTAARKRVDAMWTASRSAKAVPRLLIDRNGRLMRQEVERLFKQRDDRPVNLRE